MSACCVSSITDLTSVLLERRDPCLCIRRSASDDIAGPLLAKAAQLKTRGERVLVVCADDIVFRRYRLLLPAFPSLSERDITTMQGLCLRILARADVRAALGRGPSVLDDNEQAVLMEDLKTSGVRPRRLREMLRFFYRGISDGDNEDEDWLISAEEATVYALLEENLKARRAVLPCELPGLARRGLRECGGDEPPCSIIADGYGTLSRASQRLLDDISHGRLLIASNALGAQNSSEPYPNPEGFTAFCATHPAAASLELAIDRPAATLTHRSYPDPPAEFSGVAEAVVERLAAGILPQDILVAVPNLIWGRHVVSELEQHGVNAALDTGPVAIGGDPRSPERCAKLRLAAFLKLYLDPGNIVALRSWLGFGDWLLCSDAFLDLMAYAQQRGVGIAEALDGLRKLPIGQGPVATFAKLEKPLAELDGLLSATRKTISRKAAIDLFAQHGMALDEQMTEWLGPSPEQADIAGLAQQSCAPAPEPDEKALIVAPYARCPGRHTRTTFLTGMINGFLPSPEAIDDRYTIDHRARARDREHRLFLAIAQTAGTELVCSHFESDLLMNAKTLDMQMARVYVEDDACHARLAPSVFLAGTASCAQE
jgi:hypothetical protein